MQHQHQHDAGDTYLSTQRPPPTGLLTLTRTPKTQKTQRSVHKHKAVPTTSPSLCSCSPARTTVAYASLVVLVLCLICASPPSLTPSQVLPSPSLSPEQAVTVQLEAISHNDTPW